jgi:hypothetical protein
MPAGQFPLIRGVKYDFSSIEIDIRGNIFVDIQQIDYSDTVSRAFLRGSNAVPLGRTRGEYEASASITLSKKGAVNLRELLGAGFKEEAFDITTNYSENEEGLTTDKVIGCLIESNENSHGTGPDPLVEVIPLSVMRISWGGLDPMKNMLK